MAVLLCEPVSDLLLGLMHNRTCAHLCAIRFVDRDMFMRYRGGGIGHKYMREIEEIYENMCRERTHHKEQKHRHTPPSKDSADASSKDAMNADSGSDDEHGIGRDNGSDSDSDSDSDYQYVETDSGGSGSSGSDISDVSDSEDEFHESYGLGAL